MREPGQPPGRRGTHRHPYSALNLRLLFALFGLVTCGLLAVLAVMIEFYALSVVLAVLVVVALIDIVVVARRRRRRSDGRTLFE